MNYARELEAAKQAALMAGKVILDIYYSNETNIEYKKDHSPVTKADRLSNHTIVEYLEKRFPDYEILSEESRDDLKRLNSSLCFIIDPLDGTKEFIKHNDQFTINIALSHDHASVVGVIYAPVSNELYYASKGSGAFYVQGANEPILLHVSERLKPLRMAMSLSHAGEKEMLLIQKYGINECVRIGSSLKGCVIAKGDAEIYYRFGPTMEWDTAAMQCIVEEAGGIFRQMDDTEMWYNREDSLNAKGFYAINRIENKLEP